MVRGGNPDERDVPARLPFWLKQMAMEVGRRRVPAQSVGEVLARIAGRQLRKEHKALPPLTRANQRA